MSSPKRLSRVDASATVIRLRREPAFDAGPPTLSWADLTPSTEEKADAQQTGEPVMVSVWNEALSTLQQARAIYGRPGMLGFRLGVRAIEEESAGRCTVLADPVPGDGGDGHCGMTGCDRRTGEPKKERQNALQRIADKATLIVES